MIQVLVRDTHGLLRLCGFAEQRVLRLLNARSGSQVASPMTCSLCQPARPPRTPTPPTHRRLAAKTTALGTALRAPGRVPVPPAARDGWPTAASAVTSGLLRRWRPKASDSASLLASFSASLPASLPTRSGSMVASPARPEPLASSLLAGAGSKVAGPVATTGAHSSVLALIMLTPAPVFASLEHSDTGNKPQATTNTRHPGGDPCKEHVSPHCYRAWSS
jgi:hypothetical protein